MADSLNYISDEEESEWLANIDPSLLDKSNEENEISSFIEENRNSNITTCQFISGCLAYFCHTLPLNRYPKNSPALN